MILSEIFYAVKCDRCGCIYEGGEGYSYHTDAGSAIESAVDNDWAELNGNHYCDCCHETNEESDEVIVYEEYPPYLKTLNSFIDKVLRKYREKVIDQDELFIVKFRMNTEKQLDSCDHNYITSLIGERLVSINYELLKYHRHDCVVTIKKGI